MKHNLLKSVILSVILLMGVSNAWANGGIGYKGVKFTKDGTTTGWYNIHNVTWDYAHSSYECRSGKSGVTDFNNADLGIVTSLKLHSFVVIGWTDNSDWVSGQLKYRTYLQSASAGNYNVYNVGNYETYCNETDVLVTSGNNRVVGKNGTMNVTLVDNNTTPGKYYLQLQGMGRMRYCNGDFNTNNGSEVKASYTVPGFAKTTVSQDFGSVGVGSNISKTISFTNHYGTKLTTSDCVLSGTNTSEFSVTSISETGVTVKFTPSSVGTKSATLTITDAHSKKCTITLSGTATPPTYTVTFNANGHGTAPTAQTVTQGNKATTPAAPTATGYTFGGWYKEAYCTNAFDFNTAITEDITLYAKWTINQYTLTYSAGEGGTVSGSHPSGTKIDYNTSITLTANPAEGNILSQWVDEDGKFVSFANPYTFNLAAKNTTLKAEFAPPTTVYLKPEGYWPDASARFAIYTWGAGKTNRWVEMQHVDCENQYYSANIPTGYSDFKYVRLNPAGKGDASKDDGLHWDYKWGETGDLTLQGEDKNLYVTQRIYFKPHANWTQANARFAAYFFVNGDGEKVKWMSMFKDGDIYWCNIPNEHSYNRVIFARMNPDNEVNSFDNGTKWNQTDDLTLSQSNLYTLTGGEWDGVTGSWSTHFETFAPTYTVTLKSSSYGLYNVSINGQTHHSNYKTDVVVENVPLGAQVEVNNVMPHDPEVYNEDIIVKRSSNASYERYTNNKTFTVCGNTTIAEDFVTKEAHTLYLGVPDAMITTEWWNLRKFIWAKNETNSVIVESSNSFKIGTVTYYEITIPAGYNKFCFQSKAEGGNSTTKCQSIWFYNSIPTNNVNCFTLKDQYTTPQTLRNYEGDWTQLPATNGDFRVLYIEQEVGKEDWKTVINTTYEHSSDIIKKRTATGTDIVSLHINYDETKHPRIILQQMSSGEWVDVEGQARMAVGPLTATADKAMAPGRRNAAGEGLLTYDDGIEEIKQDKQNGYAGRVWNFTVQQTVDNGNVTAKLLLEELEPYSGDYYIRTDNAEGGWLCYNQPNNVMPYSEYSLTHSGYSHYFCKWVETKPNTKFVVANEYGAAISDTLSGEFDENGNLLSFIDEHGNLTEKANVRWMWNKYTNKVSRAYIAGSTQDDFLKVFYEDSKSKKFDDKGEWVYEVDLTDVEVGKKLTDIKAMYQGKEQQLLEKTHYDAGGVVMLASTSVTKSIYTVRVVYDFKINQTLLYLLPTDQPVSTSIDVIIERINQDEGGQATQVKANITPANQEGLTVYGVITLTKDHITDSKKSEQEALTYWISFPFDVNIADISGFGEHGKDWILRKYNGAKRAEKGWFLDTPTFWERISEGTLEANTGYVLALHTRMLNESCPLYDNTSTLKLYFPSNKKITDPISTGLTQTTCTIPTHECTIKLPRDRRDADSNWNLIGVPSFADQRKTTTNANVKYFYDYDFHNDKYDAAKTGTTTFKPMHAYMVQFGGIINWQEFSFTENGAQQLAARKNTEQENYELRLELQHNGVKADQTFVELQDDATTMFDMNIDLAKMFNAGANIYTIIGESKTEAAANVLPIANTVIPVGVQVATAGEYTFAMPDGTDGVVVELIDYEYNTRTNLLFSEYTVNLPAGTNDTRFALSVKPDKTATSMENITTPSDGELRKFIIDGVLYMQKDGVLYDAQGKLVR